MCPHNSLSFSLPLFLSLAIYIQIYSDILRDGWSMARVSVALPCKTGATSLCLNLPAKLEL